MAKYAMSIDLDSCVACDACVIACKMENNVPNGYSRDWTVQKVSGSFPNLKAELYSNRCQHCEDAPCVTVCPTEASHIVDGQVLVDQEKCVGCEQCIAACPYGARYLHPEGYVDKCTFCAHRRADERDPACVEICPTESLVFGDLDDPNSDISKLLKKRDKTYLKEEAGTKPKYILLNKTIQVEELKR